MSRRSVWQIRTLNRFKFHAKAIFHKPEIIKNIIKYVFPKIVENFKRNLFFFTYPLDCSSPAIKVSKIVFRFFHFLRWNDRFLSYRLLSVRNPPRNADEFFFLRNINLSSKKFFLEKKSDYVINIKNCIYLIFIVLTRYLKIDSVIVL